MRLRPPLLKEWEPGTGRGFDVFTDIYAPALRDRSFYGVWVLDILGRGLSTQGSFVHLFPLPFTWLHWCGWVCGLEEGTASHCSDLKSKRKS